MFNKCKRWMPLLMGIVLVATLTCCSVEDEGLAFNDKSVSDSMTESAYDGEWTVDRQVVDTARLVVGTAMRIRLPEHYLIGLCFDNPAEAMPAGTATIIQTLEQGYSELSSYNSFASETMNDTNDRMYFRTCSFGATIKGESLLVSLVSTENATAVWQKDTDQWTLAIPINAFIVKNLTTGQQTEKTLSAAFILYYHTKKRIK